MVIKEFYKTRKDGVNLYRSYSDEGKRLLQNETAYIYDEAIDVENAPYTYTEVDEGVNYINGIREIPETIPADQAFSAGEQGWWKGDVYVSLYNNNIFNPEQFAAGWKKIE